MVDIVKATYGVIDTIGLIGSLYAMTPIRAVSTFFLVLLVMVIVSMVMVVSSAAIGIIGEGSKSSGLQLRLLLDIE